MTISGVYATAVQVTNGQLYSGGVDIEIKTYRLNNENTEIESEYERKVRPAEVLSVIPRIRNNGEKCYIRAKMFYINNSIDIQKYIKGFSTNWIKRGDYYYYAKPLNENVSIKMFDTLEIPENIRAITSSRRLKLEITVEAVQEKNFAPDYSKDDPWQGLEPAQIVNSKYDMDINNNTNIRVDYENGAEENISLAKNSFSNVKSIMPGDSYTSYIQIKNTKKKDAKYYLKLNSNNPGLPSQIGLIITGQDGQVIYNDNIEVGKQVLLGQYNAGEGDILDLQMIVPAELENPHEYLDSNLDLVFSVDSDKDKKNNNINPQTGDKINVAITIFLISAIGLIIVMFIEHKERKNID